MIRRSLIFTSGLVLRVASTRMRQNTHIVETTYIFEKIERSSQPTPKHSLLHHILTILKMYTLEQLTNTLPTLEEAFRTIDDFVSLSINQVCGTHVYYTDGEAQGAAAVLTIGRKNPNYDPEDNNLANHAVESCNMYIFPDGRIMSHFMKYDGGYTSTSQYVKCVGIWLALLE